MTITIHEEISTAIIPVHLILHVTKELVGRKTWKGNRVSFETKDINIARLSACMPSALIEDKRVSREYVFRPAFQTVFPPMKHQQTALDKMVGLKYFALIMEQGTGKTKTLLDHCVKLWCDNEIDAILVLAKNGIYTQWMWEAIPQHVHPTIPLRLLSWPFEIADRHFDRSRLTIAAINFESVIFKRGMDAVTALCQGHRKRIAIIVDESQKIKNYQSSTHRAAVKLKQYSSHRFIDTGTPIGKNLEDFWAQINWLDESILNCPRVTKFRAEYCLMGGFTGHQVIGAKNVDRFVSAIEPFSFMVKKSECLDLPEKIYSQHHFVLSPAEKTAYDSMRKSLMADLSDGTISSAVSAVTALSKLQMISSGFLRNDEGEMTHLGRSRVDALRALLEDIGVDGATGKSAMIWCRFVDEIEMLAELLPSCVTYYGKTSKADRVIALDAFRSGKAKLFISNTASGGTGLDLPDATHDVIYYSNTYNAIDRWQSEDRVHRIGTTTQVRYYDLVAKSTVDRKLLANLRQKKDLSDSVIGSGEAKGGWRDQMLGMISMATDDVIDVFGALS